MKIVHTVLCVAALGCLGCRGTARSDDEEFNRINYDIYVTPVTAGPTVPDNRFRAKNPLLSWLTNVLNLQTLADTVSAVTARPPRDCVKCACGRGKTSSRIVGGEVADVKEFPWMAMLLYRGLFYCGGSLISDRHVLTAAHCVLNLSPSTVMVQLYDTERSEMVLRSVAKLYGHSGFSLDTFNNDIALVKLQQPVAIVETFSTICLPTVGRNFAGLDGVVTGWGKLANGSLAQVLQKVTVPILTNSQCKRSDYKPSRITDNMICAGFRDGGRDACQGDSGGPLHVGDSAFREQAGIVSWGEGCAQPNYPGVYTRVTRYLPWIRTYARDGCFCDRYS